MPPPTPGNARVDPGEFLGSIRRGEGSALVLHGSRARGKTALLARFRDEGGVRALWAAGSRGESAHPFGLVQQLLEPVPAAAGLARELDAPERADLAQVCRRTWQVVRELAAEGAVLLLVDDAHEADVPSARVLAHLAHRAGGHALGVVLTAGGPLREELAALPGTEVPGLDEDGARELLGTRGSVAADSALTALVELCGGNPLVTAECAASLSEQQLRGRAPLPCEPVLGAESLRVFGTLWSDLAEPARRWLHVLALSPPSLEISVHAGELLGLRLDDLEPAERAGLVRARFDRGVHWPVPWVREAVVQAAPLAESAQVCAALAETIPSEHHPAEHARCLAGALTDPDGAARALAAASVPLSRSGMLLRAHEAMISAGELATAAGERERYRITAAELSWLAGYSDHALDLLDRDPPGSGADARTSEVIVRSVIHGFRDSWTTGWRMLPLEPAGEPGGAGHAIRLLITALTAGWESASRESLLGTVARLRDVADADEVVVPGVVRPLERLVAGSSDPGEQGRGALRSLAWWAQPSDALHPKAWPPRLVPVFLGEERVYADIFAELLRTEHVRAARSTRAVLLLKLATARTALGQWEQAAEAAGLGSQLAGELGHHALRADLQLALAWIAAARGDEGACSEHLGGAVECGADNPAQSLMEHWVRGLLALSLGRPSEAFERLRELHRGPPGTPHALVLRRMSTMDAVEAAVLADRRGPATELVSEFAGWIRAGAAGWARADLARCRALLQDDDAEHWYRLALDRGPRGWSGARARLSYGAWLRRQRRDQDARAHLRAAEEEFARLGAGAWRERSHAELRATGESSPEGGGSPDALTPQERQIAELAAAGHTNRQIAAKLALSPRTVGYHLYKVFPKLDITSRAQLAAALRTGPGPSTTDHQE